MISPDDLLGFIQSDQYKGSNIDAFAAHFQISDNENFKQLVIDLNTLEEQCLIVRDEDDRYFLSADKGYAKGILRLHAHGFGFVDCEDISFYIAADALNYGMDKDEVFAIYWQNEDGSIEGKVCKILHHAISHIVGTIKNNRNDGGRFLPDSNLMKNCKIINMQEFDLVHNTKVVVKIDQYGKHLVGHIEKVLGHKYDPGMDILSLLLEHDITLDFPDDVKTEVRKISGTISLKEKAKRKDFTNDLLITIDGADAKDLDDAISFQKTTSGYQLGVHIADVSHYVKAFSPLDEEAYERGTSVYTCDRVVAMLPTKLCNDICSLLPRVERLCLTCLMEFDFEGNIISYEIMESVIKSTYRLTYDEVNEILEEIPNTVKKYQDLVGMCHEMLELSLLLRKRKEKLGALDFNKKEAKIELDKRGRSKNIVIRVRKEAEHIIEDFMIAANECVATHLKWLEIPALYRVHEQPNEKKIRAFIGIAKSLGYNFQGSVQKIYPAQLQALLKGAEGDDNYQVLSTFMLRSMQKARYDTNCIGHFGLGLNEYLHFTSPIRRYPDLVVQRMLHKYSIEKRLDSNELNKDALWCEKAAIQASERERVAVEAERDVDDMKKAEYMEERIGEVYEGIISGVTKFGVFVELANTIEGLIHISAMKDDYYQYDEVNLLLRGDRTKKTYKMGQKVLVKCCGASRFRREVDFEFIKPKKGFN